MAVGATKEEAMGSELDIGQVRQGKNLAEFTLLLSRMSDPAIIDRTLPEAEDWLQEHGAPE